MNCNGIFRSKSDMWETPQWLFDKLNEEHHFTLDACAIPENAKCENYFTPEQDGLAQEWTGVVWCNPPYGRQIGKWVQKAHDSKAETVVMLLPARTDTWWFHDLCMRGGQVSFLRGRLQFGNSHQNAPFPSMIVTFRHEGECHG